MPSSDALSPDDARILSVESPVVMGHTLKLNVLDPGPPLDLDELRAAVAARLDAEPRATQRVDTSGPEPRWVLAADFDRRPRPPSPRTGAPDQSRPL